MASPRTSRHTDKAAENGLRRQGSSPLKNSSSSSAPDREPTDAEVEKLAEELPYRVIVSLDAHLSNIVAELERDDRELDWVLVGGLMRDKFRNVKPGSSLDDLLTPQKLSKIYAHLVVMHEESVQGISQHRDYTKASAKKRLSLVLISRCCEWNKHEGVVGCRDEFKKALDVFDEVMKNRAGKAKLDETVKALDPVIKRFFEISKKVNFKDVHREFIPKFRQLYKRFGYLFPFEEAEVIEKVPTKILRATTSGENGRSATTSEPTSGRQRQTALAPLFSSPRSSRATDTVSVSKKPSLPLANLPAKASPVKNGVEVPLNASTSANPPPLIPVVVPDTPRDQSAPEPVIAARSLAAPSATPPKRPAPEELPIASTSKRLAQTAGGKASVAKATIGKTKNRSSESEPQRRISTRNEARLRIRTSVLPTELELVYGKLRSRREPAVDQAVVKTVTAFLLAENPTGSLDSTAFKLDAAEQLTSEKKKDYDRNILRPRSLVAVGKDLKGGVAVDADVFSLIAVNALAFNDPDADIVEQATAMSKLVRTTKRTLEMARRKNLAGVPEKTLSDQLKDLDKKPTDKDKETLTKKPLPEVSDADEEPIVLVPAAVQPRITRPKRAVKTQPAVPKTKKAAQTAVKSAPPKRSARK